MRNGRRLFDPPGNPVFARELLIFPNDQESCNIGEPPLIDFPPLSVTSLLCFHCRFLWFSRSLPGLFVFVLSGYFLHAPATPAECWVNGSTWEPTSQRWRAFLSGAEMGSLTPLLNYFNLGIFCTFGMHCNYSDVKLFLTKMFTYTHVFLNVGK